MANVLFCCNCARWLSCAGRFGVRDGCADILLASEDGRLASERKGVAESSFRVSKH